MLHTATQAAGQYDYVTRADTHNVPSRATRVIWPEAGGKCEGGA
jgi:hypothetical protein